MINTRYIEINSTYRDRNLWPLSSEFEIPLSQTGKKSMENSLDPVSLSMPLFSWTSNNLFINNMNGVTYINEEIQIIHKDIITGNGIIHVIDNIILPSHFYD